MNLSPVNIALLIFILAWAIAGIYQLRYVSSSKGIRRSVFICVALAGILLLIFKPSISIQTNNKRVLLLQLQEDNEDFIRKDYDYVFENFYEYLNSPYYQRKDSLFIIGEGLEPEDLSLLKDIPKKIIIKNVHGGFSDIKIPTVKSYRPFEITGTVDLVNARGVKVVAPDGKEYYSSLEKQVFSIKLQAREAGPFLYDIHLIQENDTLCEKLPIVVEEDKPWKILVLNSSPSFENNFLKNHFGEQGKEFTIRQKISQDKYQYSYTNTGRHTIFPLNKTSLLRYDFCLIDVATWNSMGSDNRNNVLEEVKNRGLSLLIKPDRQAVARDIPTYRVRSQEPISWQEDNREVEITATYLSTNRNYREIQSQGHIIGYYANHGVGKIGIVGIESSYLLLLNEMENSYQKIWTDLLSVFYTPVVASTIIETPYWNFENTSIPLHVITSEEKPQLLLNDSIRVAMHESPFVSSYYLAKTFAEDGWQNLRLSTDTTKHWFYVHPETTWQVLRNQNLKLINERAEAISSDGSVHMGKIPMPWYYGFLLSVLGLGLLWLDERLND